MATTNFNLWYLPAANGSFGKRTTQICRELWEATEAIMGSGWEWGLSLDC